MQGLEQLANAGIHLVFKSSSGHIVFPKQQRAALGGSRIHAGIALKGIHQRRADVLAQPRFVRNGQVHFAQRIAHGVGDAVVGVGQRAVQIKNYRIVAHGVFSHYHSKSRVRKARTRLKHPRVIA